MGGSLSLVAEFPDREPVVLSGIAEDGTVPLRLGGGAHSPVLGFALSSEDGFKIISEKGSSALADERIVLVRMIGLNLHSHYRNWNLNPLERLVRHGERWRIRGLRRNGMVGTGGTRLLRICFCPLPSPATAKVTAPRFSHRPPPHPEGNPSSLVISIHPGTEGARPGGLVKCACFRTQMA